MKGITLRDLGIKIYFYFVFIHVVYYICKLHLVYRKHQGRLYQQQYCGIFKVFRTKQILKYIYIYARSRVKHVIQKQNKELKLISESPFKNIFAIIQNKKFY